MIRTIISLSEEDKKWLEEQAAIEGVPMTEMVRRAVRRLREQLERESPPMEELLRRTSGIWPGEDGLQYQRRLRDEW